MYFASPYLGIGDSARFLVSLIWGFMILIIDAAIVATLKAPVFAQGISLIRIILTVSLFLITLSLRLGYSLVTAAVISHPVVLKVFEGKINDEITFMRFEREDSVRFTLQQQKDTALTLLRAAAKEANDKAECLEIAYRIEVSNKKMVEYPCDLGPSSGMPSEGKRARRLAKQAVDLRYSGDSIINEIRIINTRFDSLTSERVSTVKLQFGSDYLDRVVALGRLKDKEKQENHNYVAQAQGWLFLFLLLLDTLAVMIKVLMSRDSYDRKNTVIEDSDNSTTDQYYSNLAGKYSSAYQADLAYSVDAINDIYAHSRHRPPSEIRASVEAYLKHPIRMLAAEWVTIRQAEADTERLKRLGGKTFFIGIFVLIVLLYIHYNLGFIPNKEAWGYLSSIVTGLVSSFIWDFITKKQN